MQKIQGGRPHHGCRRQWLLDTGLILQCLGTGLESSDSNSDQLSEKGSSKLCAPLPWVFQIPAGLAKSSTAQSAPG